jgi:hypothetical protein
MQLLAYLVWCVAAVAMTRCDARESEPRGSAKGNRQAQAQPIRVTDLRLINADTNQPIPGYEPLWNNSRIDISALSTANLNVEAFTEGLIGSLQWSFDDTLRNENVAPWALCGNSGSDFFRCDKIKEGLKTVIRVTPYSGKGATGAAGTSLSIGIEFFKSTPIVPMRMFLMTAKFDYELSPLVNGTNVNLFSDPEVNVRVDVVSALVKSVEFFYDGSFYRIDNVAPYSFNGNSGTDYFPWTPTVGQHSITAVAYTGKDAKGSVLSRVSASFNVTGRDDKPPMLIDLKAVSPLEVDVTKGRVDVRLEAAAQDDLSGLYAVNILAILNNGTTAESAYTNDFEAFLSEGQTVQKWNATLRFDQSKPTGDYYLSVVLEDNNDPRNKAPLTAEELKDRGFPSIIKVVNNSPKDKEPPKLLNFTATTPTTVALSTGLTTANFQVLVRDDGVGFGTGFLTANQQNIVNPKFARCIFVDTRFATDDTQPIAGRPVLFNVTLYFERCETNTYLLSLFLTDSVSNFQSLDSDELGTLGFPTNITVLP